MALDVPTHVGRTENVDLHGKNLSDPCRKLFWGLARRVFALYFGDLPAFYHLFSTTFYYTFMQTTFLLHGKNCPTTWVGNVYRKAESAPLSDLDACVTPLGTRAPAISRSVTPLGTRVVELEL